MYCKQLLIYGFVSVIISTSTVAGLKKDKYYCEKSSPCTCVSPNNNNIDLANLNVNLNLTTDVLFNYQPCPSAEHNTTSATIEMVNATVNGTITIPIAYYEDVKFEIGDAVMLVYENDTNKFEVILSCDPLAVNGHEYLTDFQNDTNNHSMITLKTSEVCGLNLKDSIENSSNSWSSFFSLLLFVAFIYFVGGSIVNACLFNEMGINMIPHHEFWSSVCNYIQEKLCGTSTMASTYESI